MLWQAVEDEAHALLVYTELQPLRERFLRDIYDQVGGLEHKWTADRPYDFLKWLLSRKIVLCLAKFVADILAVYDSYPRYIPAILYLPAAVQ
jgi:hypothetical protein